MSKKAKRINFLVGLILICVISMFSTKAFSEDNYSNTCHKAVQVQTIDKLGTSLRPFLCMSMIITPLGPRIFFGDSRGNRYIASFSLNSLKCGCAIVPAIKDVTVARESGDMLFAASSIIDKGKIYSAVGAITGYASLTSGSSRVSEFYRLNQFTLSKLDDDSPQPLESHIALYATTGKSEIVPDYSIAMLGETPIIATCDRYGDLKLFRDNKRLLNTIAAPPSSYHQKVSLVTTKNALYACSRTVSKLESSSGKIVLYTIDSKGNSTNLKSLDLAFPPSDSSDGEGFRLDRDWAKPVMLLDNQEATPNTIHICYLKYVKGAAKIIYTAYNIQDNTLAPKEIIVSDYPAIEKLDMTQDTKGNIWFAYYNRLHDKGQNTINVKKHGDINWRHFPVTKINNIAVTPVSLSLKAGNEQCGKSEVYLIYYPYKDDSSFGCVMLSSNTPAAKL